MSTQARFSGWSKFKKIGENVDEHKKNNERVLLDVVL